MEKELVSILTLSYNNFENKKETIDSIFMQKYENIEWIFSDDGSSDFEKEKKEIEEYIKKLQIKKGIKNVSILHNKSNVGIVRNYKKALEKSSGKYVFYLAMGDSFYDENVIEDVVKYFETTGYDFFGGVWKWIAKDGTNEFYPGETIKKIFSEGNNKKIYTYFIRYPLLVGACTPFKRELYEKYGFLPEEYTHLEDWPRYLDWMEHDASIGFYDRILIRYYEGGLTTHITNPDLIQDFKYLMEKRMHYPYTEMFEALKNKKYIVSWGASGGFLKNYRTWETTVGRKCDFIVDSDPAKTGTQIDGRTVYLPSKLKEINPNDFFVLIFSMAYFIEIAEELLQMGFFPGKHFELISRELMLWQCGKYDQD